MRGGAATAGAQDRRTGELRLAVRIWPLLLAAVLRLLPFTVFSTLLVPIAGGTSQHQPCSDRYDERSHPNHLLEAISAVTGLPKGEDLVNVKTLPTSGVIRTQSSYDLPRCHGVSRLTAAKPPL